MTQENKELLLQDIYARLPYGVKCKAYDCINYPYNGDGFIIAIGQNYIETTYSSEEGIFPVGRVLPYLRPMSSMTEKEAKELLFVRLASKYGESCAYIKNFIKLNEVSFQKKSPYEGSIAVWFSFKNKIHDTNQIREYSSVEYLGQTKNITLTEIDWLNKHHFDYRGLITKGLALEAPEGMYN